MATRTRTRKQQNSKPATEQATAQQPTPHTPLPVRRRDFTGPYTPHQLTEARAALASVTAQLPIPTLLWLTQINGRAAARLGDGTLLTHNGPAHQPNFTAHIPCPHGALHEHTVHTAHQLAEARATTTLCQTPHGTPDQDTAITRGTTPTTQPKTSAVLQLHEGVHRAQAAATDTQPLALDDITTGLTTHADNDTAKEHPQL